ncbi:MAG: Txe/YoeB family addiction module toxin [Schwartzia sp.]|nr:Txe/YoeB family addiction module toxin [Schwartzia sp. (in: firmicutes)]
MRKLWDDAAWNEYLYWQAHDKKILGRINDLVKSIERDGVSKGIGKPEKLKHRTGWSRRINKENRLLYAVDDNGFLHILSCKGRYED